MSATESVSIDLPRKRIKSGENILSSIPIYEQPPTQDLTAIDQLLRLDAWVRPGLSELEFTQLFAKCPCGLIMTRRVFKDHKCFVIPTRPPPAIIDLTLEADDQSIPSTSALPTIIDLTTDSDDDST
ncbi:hypothetical protein PILCRDRAFT_15689 [Piloderma croceum F 1598]|uniref:Uncharacterized protein n=1 Tax=Piloderma croceum (strain F 1598) TaxID=765440 RepID=A0A0C3AGI4_PILCF|nr:hypothetical protein PILCRDRAFT_15689 [Piloderma croceum F 1598]